MKPARQCSRRTALSSLSPSGWAEITHPFHPLRGQRFLISKRCPVSGVDALILRGIGGDGFAVAREWTDQADSSPRSPTILDMKHLLELAVYLESLREESKKELDR